MPTQARRHYPGHPTVNAQIREHFQEKEEAVMSGEDFDAKTQEEHRNERILAVLDEQRRQLHKKATAEDFVNLLKKIEEMMPHNMSAREYREATAANTLESELCLLGFYRQELHRNATAGAAVSKEVIAKSKLDVDLQEFVVKQASLDYDYTKTGGTR
jgi:hypothetical protein